MKARSFRGQTSGERTAERREKLVAAATFEFGERGFHGVTVREVCKRAQLTERYFYESFDNLAALFAVVFEHVDDQLKRETLEALKGATREPLALAEAAIRAYLVFLMKDAARAKVLLIESVAGDRDVLGAAVRRRNDYVMLLRGYVQFLYPWLVDPRRDASLLLVCTGLIGATNYIASDWVHDGYRTRIEVVLESILVLFRGVILHAATLEPAPSVPKPKVGRRK